MEFVTFPCEKEIQKLTSQLLCVTMINDKNDAAFGKEQSLKMFKLNCKNMQGNPGNFATLELVAFISEQCQLLLVLTGV